MEHITPAKVQFVLQYTKDNTQQSADVTEDFSGWNSFATEIDRDSLTGAYILIQDGGIKFTGKSYKIIKSLYDAYEIEAQAKLLINLRKDTFPDLWSYEQKYALDLNFSTYEETETEITINANENGLKQTIASNGSQKYDIPVAPISSEKLDYDGINVKESFSYFVTENIYYPARDYLFAGGNLFFLPNILYNTSDVDSSLNNVLEYGSQSIMSIINSKWSEWNDDDSSWINSTELDSDKNPTFKPILVLSGNQEFSLNISISLCVSGSYSLNPGSIYLVHDDSPLNYLGSNSIKICDFDSSTVKINNTISVSGLKGQKYYILCVLYGTREADSSYTFGSFGISSGGTMKIEWMSIPKSHISIPVVSEQALLQSLINKVTESAANYVISYTYSGGIAKTGMCFRNYTPALMVSYDSGPYGVTGKATPSISVLSDSPAGVYVDGSKVFSAPEGVVIDSATGEIDLAASTQGTYFIKCSFLVTATSEQESDTPTYEDYIYTAITITSDTTTISYKTAPSNGVLSPTITGVTGGTFSASPEGMMINSSTGGITTASTSRDIYHGTVDDHTETIRVAAGESIRNFPKQFIHTSLSDFIKYMQSAWGYEYEIIGNTLHFGLRDNLFKSVPALTIEDVMNYKKSINTDFVYTGVKIGNSKVEYQSINGTDEFRFLEEWSTGVQNVVNTLDLTNPYRTDAFGFQLLAEKQYDKNSTDDKSDDSVFVIHVNTSNGMVVDRTNTITGVNSPETMFNVIFSPRLCLIRNASLLGVSCKTLKFTSTSGFAGIKINGVSEMSDISIPSRIFSPMMIDIEVGKILDLPSVVNGVVSFTYKGVTYQGFIKKLSHFWGSDQKTTCTLFLR